MQGPSCHQQNSPMSARCINCNTLLIEQSQPRTEQYKKGARWVDARIYSGVCGFAGLLLGMFLFSREPIAIAIVAFIGSAIGRFIAYRKNKDL